jgi:hypothetical protein
MKWLLPRGTTSTAVVDGDLSEKRKEKGGGEVVGTDQKEDEKVRARSRIDICWIKMESAG